MRTLAARSANAAKETTEMIESSIQKVGGGMKIADETAVSLNRIVEDISKVAVLVSRISDASIEQSASVSQINQGLVQVSQVIQTNSATSEESAAASEELTGQAEMLKEQVSRFNLRQGFSFSSREFGETGFRAYRTPELGGVKSRNTSSVDKAFAEAAAGMKTLSLSDKEFGKY